MATELAKAYVQIIPSARDMQGSISEALGGEADSAGKESGKKYASGLGSSLKKALVGVGIGKILTDAIGNASEFQTAMAKTSTLFTGDAKAFSALKNEILGLSSEYGLAATTLAEAAYSAESAGVKAEQLGPMLEGSARLAVAGFTDIDTALSATAKTMNAYGDAAMSAEDIQKVLIQTQNLGITTVGELGASLANVTPTAAAMGVGFDQVGAAMAQMTASGVQTAQATTQLRAAMTELGKSGTKADQAFREAAKGTQYAGMSFQEAQASGANLGDVFGLMQKYADATGVSMVDLWGSVEAGNAAMLIASDVDKFNENLEAMATDADVVGEAYGKMADTFGTSMNKLKESAKNFMTTLFEGGDIATAFDNMLGSLGDVGEKLKTWLTTGLKTLGENLPKLVASLWDFGAGILQSLAEVDWIDLGVTIINGIIGGLGTLGKKLIELVSGAVKAVANGEIDFGSIGTAIWNGVTSIITTAGGWLKTLFETAVGAVTGEGGIDFGSIGSAILGGITSFLDAAGNFLSNIFKAGRDKVTDGTTIDWGKVGQSILNGVTSAIDMAGAFLEGAFTAGKKLVEAIDWGNVGTVIGNGVNGVVDTAGKFLEGCFTSAKALIEKIDWNNIGKVIGDGVNSTVDLAGKFLEGCFKAGKKLVESIRWENIGSAIASGVNGFIDVAGKFLEGCFKAGKALVEAIDWANIGTTIANGVNGTVDTAGKFLEGCFTSAKSLIEKIDWANIGTKIGSAINTTIDAAGAFLEAPFKAAKGLIEGIKWSEIGTSISNGITGTIDSAGKFLSSSFDAAKKLIDAIKWNEVGTAISNGVTGTIDTAGNFLEASFTAAKDLIVAIPWNEVGQAISGGLGDVWSGLTGFLGGVLGGAGDAISGAGSFVGSTLEGVGDAVKNLLSGSDAKQAVEDLKNTMKELKSAIDTGKKDVSEAAKNVSKDILEGLKSELTTENLDSLGKGADEQVMSSISTAVTAAKAGLHTDIEGVRNNMIDTFKMESKWISAGTFVINKVKKGIDDNTSLSRTFDNLVKDLTKKLDNDQFDTAGSNIITRLISGIKSQSLALMLAAMTQASTIVNTFGAVNWSATGSDVVKGIVSGINYTAGQLNGALGNLVGYCSSAADSMYNAFNIGWFYIGYNIVDGIVSGINSRSGTLYNTMYNLAETAMDCARRELGIASPSKVMRDEVGRWIPAGIAAGIEQYAGLVDNAMEDLTDLNMSGMQNSLMDQTMGLMYGAGSIGASGNDQFVEDITQGVTDANEEQNALLREEISLLRQILEKETTVRVGASVGLGRTVRQSLDMYNAVGG